MTNAFQTAARNFQQQIKDNAYPGRGLVVGRCEDQGHWVLIYWIMGRSSHSRNRRFVATGPVLRTVPVDESKVDDPSLIIYEAMLELPGIYLVTNGDQTRTLYETITAGGTFDDAMATREREPDAPNYTPRISAALDVRQSPGAQTAVTLSLLKANPVDPLLTDRYTYRPAAPPPGLGFALTTYSSDGDPLPSFTGDPLLLPCRGDAKTICKTYWDALDADNRVALAVKQIPSDGGSSELIIQNRY
jgi:IMP cyclohydrolase